MASSLDLYIDTSTGELLQGGASASGSLPTLTRNDSYNLRLRLLGKQSNGLYDDIDLAGAGLRAGIGSIEDPPSAGAFKLSCNGITSGAINYNASALELYNAISNNVSTVNLYGGDSSAYLLTATQSNTAMSFSADTFTLFPSSTILIGTRRNPTTGIAAQQTVRLIKNPVVYADSFIDAPTASEIVLTKIQDGSSTQNETYELTIGSGVRGGSYALVYGPNATTGIAVGASAVTVQTAISAGISTITANCSVQENGNGGYIISFTGRLGLTNITTALTLDASGIQFIPFKQTTLTLGTAELEDAFAEAGTDTITPTLEIELTQNGTPKTIFQGSVTIRKDLITTGASVPGAQASYYTKTEADAAFVSRVGDVGFYGTTPISQPANTSVVSALVNLGLVASTVTLNEAGAFYPTVALTGSAITVTDSIPFVFGTTTGTKIGTATGQKIAFYNSTPIVQPTGTSVVSALVNLGLVASSVTLGIPSNVVTDWAQNISATTRFLSDNTGVTSVDWQNRVLKNSSGITSVDWQNSSFGSGSPAVTIALNNISVSGGYYIAMGTSNGAFRTLSTTASLNFGTLAGHNNSYLNVTVTGAVVNDIVLLGIPNSICAGIAYVGNVITSNTVCIGALNTVNSSANTITGTFRITVLDYQ